MAKMKARVMPMPLATTAQQEDAGSTDKQERIKAEVSRLQRIYSRVDKKNKALIDGLIRRAAFMRVSLEDQEQDLIARGYVEWFSQSPDTDPYERARPISQIYNSMNKNYQSIMKQLGDLVPPPPPPEEKGDGFDEFVAARGDR